jgi:hypothetical protein
MRGAPARPGADGRGLWWASPRDRPHPSAKRGEREREWQVGPTAI